MGDERGESVVVGEGTGDNVQSQKRRRRHSGAERFVKATFQISESVMQAVKGAVARGDVPSANSLVEEAIVERLRLIRRAALAHAYAGAMADPAFVADLDETTRTFEGTATDGLAEPHRS